MVLLRQDVRQRPPTWPAEFLDSLRPSIAQMWDVPAIFGRAVVPENWGVCPNLVHAFSVCRWFSTTRREKTEAAPNNLFSSVARDPVRP